MEDKPIPIPASDEAAYRSMSALVATSVISGAVGAATTQAINALSSKPEPPPQPPQTTEVNVMVVNIDLTAPKE